MIQGSLQPTYTDDLTIIAGTALWRRIPSIHIVPTSDGSWRISSAAFEDTKKPSPSPMSVVIERVGRNPTEILDGLNGFSIAAVTAGFVRSVEQGVQRDPVLNDPIHPDEPDHALVFGPKRKPIKNKLAAEASANWVIFNPP